MVGGTWRKLLGIINYNTFIYSPKYKADFNGGCVVDRDKSWIPGQLGSRSETPANCLNSLSETSSPDKVETK